MFFLRLTEFCISVLWGIVCFIVARFSEMFFFYTFCSLIAYMNITIIIVVHL